jgi:hypothetical protein
MKKFLMIMMKLLLLTMDEKVFDDHDEVVVVDHE